VKDNLGSKFFNRPDARCTRIYTGSDIRETAGVIGEVGTTIVRADIYIVYIYIYIKKKVLLAERPKTWLWARCRQTGGRPNSAAATARWH